MAECATSISWASALGFPALVFAALAGLALLAWAGLFSK